MNTIKFSEDPDPEIITDVPEPYSPDTTSINPKIQAARRLAVHL